MCPSPQLPGPWLVAATCHLAIACAGDSFLFHILHKALLPSKHACWGHSSADPTHRLTPIHFGVDVRCLSIRPLSSSPSLRAPIMHTNTPAPSTSSGVRLATCRPCNYDGSCIEQLLGSLHIVNPAQHFKYATRSCSELTGQWVVARTGQHCMEWDSHARINSSEGLKVEPPGGPPPPCGIHV